MQKKIYIVNGMGGCGKDTFAQFLTEIVSTMKISSVDKVKRLAKFCGWEGGKTEKDRKFLSDLKCLTSEYSDFAFRDIRTQVEYFKIVDLYNVLLIDIREPDEIERAKNEFGAKTILITNDRVEPILSNMADANVFEYTYDYIINNSGSFEDFKANIKIFAEAEELCTSENLVKE